MKKQFFLIATAALLAATLSCDGLYTIKKETSEKTSLNNYKTIVIGWLKLNEDEWQSYKFKNKDEWLSEIRRINCGILQKKLQEMLKNRNLLFALSKESAFPVRGDLFISFGDIRIEKNWKLICILSKEKKRISWPKKDHHLEFRKDSLVKLSLDINVCNGLYYELDSNRILINVKDCSIQCCDGFTALNFADAFPDTFFYKLTVDSLELNSTRYSILMKI